MGNLFLEDSGDMLTLDTKVVMNKDVIQTVNAVEEIGQRQFSEFVENRLKSASNKPLSDIVSSIKLALYSIPQAKQRSSSKEQGASLQTNCTLFYRLYIACQARQSNLDSLAITAGSFARKSVFPAPTLLCAASCSYNIIEQLWGEL